MDLSIDVIYHIIGQTSLQLENTGVGGWNGCGTMAECTLVLVHARSIIPSPMMRIHKDSVLGYIPTREALPVSLITPSPYRIAPRMTRQLPVFQCVTV
jgi:hypothetical protein